METVICPRCGNDRGSRVRRVGFLQSSVLPYFGLYPWECGRCRKVFLSKNRGKLKRKRNPEGEPRVPTVG